MPTPLLEVQELSTFVFSRWGTVRAVDGVSFALYEGETLGLVGESGCGKSMTCRSLVRLLPPAARIVGGKCLFQGEDLLAKREDEMRRYRGRHIALILQDPMTALNPVLMIGEQVAEVLRLHKRIRGPAVLEKVVNALNELRIASPEFFVKNYPHQMSGGMRQRVAAAIALAGEPQVLIADEPTTALDTTIQAQYLALLKYIQRKRATSIIFVTHDLGIVAKMCDRVAVLYAGKIVELASVMDLFDRPAHPYTRALLSSVPALARRKERLPYIAGQPPCLNDLPPGCRFAPRCPHAFERCQQEEPPLTEVKSGQLTRCWYPK